MALWDKSSKFPTFLNTKDKHRTEVTDKGYEYNLSYTDASNTARNKSYVLVPIAGLANSSNWGQTKIIDVYHSTSTGTAPATLKTYIQFSEPVSIDAAASISIYDETSNTNILATSPATVDMSSNRLGFSWVANTAGTYSIAAQSLANTTSTAINIKSTNAGLESANVAISSTLATAAGTVVIS